MTEQTLAFANPSYSPNPSQAPLQIAENVRQVAPRTLRARLLVIGEDRNWLNEVLALVPSDCAEVECKTHDGIDHQSLHSLSQTADLVVLLGSVASHAPLGAEALSPTKPIVWLPIPASNDALADASVIWRKGAALAMRTALKHLQHRTTPEAELTAIAGEEPQLDASARELRQGDRSVRVTPTECNLLRVLLASRGTWIPASELRLRAFGPDHACHDSLIRVHVYKLRRKLGCMTAEIRSAKGRGYMFA